MRLVATVTSRLASSTQSRTVLTLFPTASPMSHRNARKPLIRSLSMPRVARRARTSRSMSEPGCSSPLPYPPTATSAWWGSAVVESETTPREHQDAVHEPRPGFDEQIHPRALAKTRLQMRLRCGDRVAHSSEGRVHVVRGGERGRPLRRDGPPAPRRVGHSRVERSLACVGLASRRNFSAHATASRALGPSHDSCPRPACRAASCPGRLRGGPSRGLASNACRARSGCSRAARRRP